MKTLYVTMATIALMLTGQVMAQETDPAHLIAEQWRAEQVASEARQIRLEELMSTMAQEMEAIRSADDSDQRQALMVAHRDNMQEAIWLMRELGGLHMREVMAQHLGPTTGSGGESDASSLHPQHSRPMRPRDQMSDSQRLADVENRMDMTQIMIESIVGEQSKH